jgi:hypothetical protein
MRPTVPSPEVEAFIQRHIDEMQTEGLQNWLWRVCKELNALPIHGTILYLWALRPDGLVLCIDHEAFNHPTEPETDPRRLYAALHRGARIYPELRELVGPAPAETRPCPACGGSGSTEAAPGEAARGVCDRCDGLGWFYPGPWFR